MPFLSYPDAAEVELLMKSTGYWPTNSTGALLAKRQAEIGAEAAAAAWETQTGWKPFLSPAGAVATEKEFELVPGEAFVSLYGGALSITSVERSGQPLTAGQGYRAIRAFPGGPIVALDAGRARHYRYTSGGSLYAAPFTVTAVWGYASEVPADVYQAILQKAALIVLSQIQNNQSIASLSVDGFSKSLDIVGIVTQKDLVTGIWGKDFDKVSARYKRVVL